MWQIEFIKGTHALREYSIGYLDLRLCGASSHKLYGVLQHLNFTRGITQFLGTYTELHCDHLQTKLHLVRVCG